MTLFLFYTGLALAIQALFALFEMAAVSLSRIRLQHKEALHDPRAKALGALLRKPSRLFGTTLIGVNAALQAGSECSRRVYEEIGLSPDWAPLTQVVLVVIFAELSPLFAARRHPEQVAMALAPLMRALSFVLAPVLWAFNGLSHLVHRLMGTKAEVPLFLSKEEVSMAFEETGGGELQEAVERIFALKEGKAADWMQPMEEMAQVDPHMAVDKLRVSFETPPSFVSVMHRGQVLGVASLRSLLRAGAKARVLDFSRAPWFLAASTPLFELLDLFRQGNQNMAVLLDPQGEPVGFLTLERLLDRLFGCASGAGLSEERGLFVERTFSGELLVSAFNAEFHTDFSHREGQTMGSWLAEKLGSAPVKGEVLEEGGFEFSVEEVTLLGIKTFSVRTS